MKLESLTLENFGPYKFQEIDFTQFKTNKVLIIGENRDEEGSDSNGSGKSRVFEAVTWAISGKTSKEGKVKSEDVIGPFDDKTKVTLTLTGKFHLRIERVKGVKSSFEFWVNDESKSVPDNSKKTMANLLMYLGVSPIFQNNWFDDFMTMTYFSNEVAKVFTNTSSRPADRYAFISRYLSLEILDLCKENTKSKLDDISSDLLKLNSSLELIDSRLKGLKDKKQIESEIKTLNTLKQQKNEDLKLLEKELNDILKTQELKNQILNKQELIKNKSSELEEKLNSLKNSYQSKLEEYEELKDVDTQIEELKTKLNKIKIDPLYQKQSDLEETKSEINNQSIETEHLINNELNEILRLNDYKEQKTECPRCNANLMVINNKIHLLDLSEIETLISTSENKKEKFELQYNQSKEKLSEIQDSIKEIQTEIDLYTTIKNKLEVLEFKSSNKSKLLKEINDIVEQKETWEKTTIDYIASEKNQLQLLKTQLDSIGTNKTKEDYDTKNKKINEEIQEIVSNLDRNQYILEKLIEEINSRKEIEKELSELNRNREKLLFTLEAFPTIKKWRIDDFIPSFKLEVNSILRNLKSKIKVIIDTDSETKKGTIKDNFPIEAIDQYNKTRGLETYSEGEKTRISIAIAWALRNLTKDQNYLPFEFCMMDEIADGLDEKGIINLSSLIDQTEGQFYVISHFNAFKNQFSEVITVIKENGESKIEIK